MILKEVNADMPMRVIAGNYRHRKLLYPEDNKDIRPTKDRIREAFFSSLGDITGKSFLDLYAGCGSIGIESISRGESYATFVDINHTSIGFVKKNIESLKIENAEVLKISDEVALAKFKSEGRNFDIIYLDPPYESDRYEIALKSIFDNDLLNDNGVLAIETKRPIEINPLWQARIKEYHYGEINVIVLRK